MLALSLTLHGRLLITLLAVFAALGLWSALAAARNAAVSGRYLAALGVGELTLVLEGALGLVLLAGGLQPGRLWLHLMYGLAAALVLPLALIFSRRRPPRQRHWILAVVCLLLCGLALRSQATGHAAGS